MTTDPSAASVLGNRTPGERHSVTLDLGIAPDENGCYGWPRACEHDDDLACTIAEEIARDPSFADLLDDADRAFERRYPGLNRPVAVKPNLRRRGWRRGR